MTKFYVDISGNYLGGFDGAEPPEGSIEVPNPPTDGRQKWADGAWQSLTIVPAEVTYRQGMAVLIKRGHDAQIDAALNAQLAAATQSGDAAAILAAKLAINDWKHSTAFLRAWPLIAQMQAAFQWSDSYVDGMFVEAATL